MKLIDNAYYMLDKEIDKILYFYNIINDTIKEIGERQKVTLVQGFSLDYIKDWPKEQRLWIIIDDHLVKEVYHEIADLFAVHSRGKDICVTLITQNLFTKAGNASKYNRDLVINRSYSVFFPCKADDNQVKTVARSCHINYYTFMSAFFLATGYKMGHEYGKVSELEQDNETKKKNAHKYLMLSLTPYTKPEIELRSDIFFREENTLLFWPK